MNIECCISWGALLNDLTYIYCEMIAVINLCAYLFIYLLFYCCSNAVVCIFLPPLAPQQPSSRASPESIPPGFVHVTFRVIPENPSTLSPFYTLHLPTGYCKFVLNFNVSGYIVLLVCLLIRFHLKVRSSGIFLSLSGLFHIEWCSPVPSMLLQKAGAASSFLLHSILSCKCTIVSWSTHFLMGT